MILLHDTCLTASSSLRLDPSCSGAPAGLAVVSIALTARRISAPGRTRSTSITTREVTEASTLVVGAGLGELLGKRRALAQLWAFPVDDVYRQNKHSGYTEKDCGGVCKVLISTSISTDVYEVLVIVQERNTHRTHLYRTEWQAV